MSIFYDFNVNRSIHQLQSVRMAPPNQPQQPNEPAAPPKREQPLSVPTVGVGKDQVCLSLTLL